ncbi:MAG TPA: alpha/beta hydrolase, partial [Sphingomonas sp.]|nr:alpha/beta hydrolase [Sphingomonas sp.]
MTEPFVRPDVAAFLAYLNGLPGPRTHELTAEAARELARAARDLADAPVGELAVMRDLAMKGHGGVRIALRLFDARAERGDGPLMLFFHGGGFVFGDLDTHAPACAEMARALDLPVLAVDYRLAPEHPWPAAPRDCEAAARWAAEGADALGFAPTGLVLAGDSAGGTLAITTAMALRDTPAAVPVIAQFPIYPAADLATHYPSYKAFEQGYLLDSETLRWFDQAYRADVSDWRGSPMAGSLESLPPALVLTAGLDPIRDQGRAYAAALAMQGAPVIFREAAGQIHGFLTLRRAVPSAETDLAGALRALKAML